MLKQLRNKTEGFTIIEVMIVLAIAGLILLIVFLAVPALQRNQRNTARRTEAGRLGAAANEWKANNSGQAITSTNAATAAAEMYASAGVLQQYVPATTFTINTSLVPTSTAITTPLTTAQVILYVNGACSGNDAVYQINNFAIRFGLEPSGNVTACFNV